MSSERKYLAGLVWPHRQLADRAGPTVFRGPTCRSWNDTVLCKRLAEMEIAFLPSITQGVWNNGCCWLLGKYTARIHSILAGNTPCRVQNGEAAIHRKCMWKIDTGPTAPSVQYRPGACQQIHDDRQPSPHSRMYLYGHTLLHMCT